MTVKISLTACQSVGNYSAEKVELLWLKLEEGKSVYKCATTICCVYAAMQDKSVFRLYTLPRASNFSTRVPRTPCGMWHNYSGAVGLFLKICKSGIFVKYERFFVVVVVVKNDTLNTFVGPLHFRKAADLLFVCFLLLLLKISRKSDMKLIQRQRD